MLGRNNVHRVIAIVLFTSFIVGLWGCASISKRLREVNRSRVETAPYYTTVESSLQNVWEPVAHLPIVTDRRIKTNKPAFGLLLAEINQALNQQGWTTQLAPIRLPLEAAPEIYVGNQEGSNSPLSGTYEKRSSENIDDLHPPMIIYTVEPSQQWRDSLKTQMHEKGANSAIFLMLGMSEYFMEEEFFHTSKMLSLGTGFRQPFEKVVLISQPIQVLHISGVLLDHNGRIVRAGAEGIYAWQTDSYNPNQILQPEITTELIEQISYDFRREELSFQPLAWQVALQNLIGQLLQNEDMLIE